MPDAVGRKWNQERADIVCRIYIVARSRLPDGSNRDGIDRRLPAVMVRLRTLDGGRRAAGKGRVGGWVTNVLIASAELEPSEVQDLGDIMPDLLKIKARAKAPIRFHVRVELGDGKTLPSREATDEFNEILKKVKEEFQLR